MGDIVSVMDTTDPKGICAMSITKNPLLEDTCDLVKTYADYNTIKDLDFCVSLIDTNGKVLLTGKDDTFVYSIETTMAHLVLKKKFIVG